MINALSSLGRQVVKNHNFQKRFSLWANQFASQKSKLYESAAKAVHLERENQRLIKENEFLRKEYSLLDKKLSNYITKYKEVAHIKARALDQEASRDFIAALPVVGMIVVAIGYINSLFRLDKAITYHLEKISLTWKR